MKTPADAAAARAAARAADAAVTEAWWSDFELLGSRLETAKWVFARTMPQNPHWYTLRRRWAEDADFSWVAAQIRQRGYRQQFGKTHYTQLDINDHFYWTMGWPVNQPDGEACTILINRKPIAYEADRVALYDSIQPEVHSYARVERVFEVLAEFGPFEGADILDVGCGPGLAVSFVDGAASYLGIDPSIEMLKQHRSSYPDYKTIHTTLDAFVPPHLGQRYDWVLALFGTGSYLSDRELARIPWLLKPGGRAAVMFYTSRSPHGKVFRRWEPDLFPGAVVKFPTFTTALFQREGA